ncbi:MAG: phytoene desaturase family protein [Weeksellaceae bacterium]|nr:phytoene desaturase family protein [Weeksellaceae bacterium]
MTVRIAILGSGFSSLSAATYLQKYGCQVTVFEKNEQIGGRASVLEENGFRFDMGPSWYWMPDVFERYFADFNYKPSDFYSLEKLDPAYRVIFGENDSIDISANLEEVISTFENIDPGSGKPLRKFMQQSRDNYSIAMQDLVYEPGIRITELITPATAKKLNLFVQNISGQTSKITSDPRLQSILDFPVLFLGAKPQNTPAFYNFMNWADFGLGTWYPQGGMHQIVQAMERIALELGVEFHTDNQVTKLEVHDQRIKTVHTNTGTYEFDVVVSGADYAATEQLLDSKFRNFTDQYWQKKTFAPSAILFYLGINQKVEKLLHHNLFFDTDFNQHAREIYDKPAFPQKPLFYANFSSKTDSSLAPEGKDSGFILIPVAVDLEDDEQIHQHYYELVMERLEKFTGQALREYVEYKKSFGVQDFKTRYNSCRGNAYGLANTLMQTSVLRPGIRNKKLKNLFYTGQLTVPGPGVPPALISGKIVADFIKKNVI